MRSCCARMMKLVDIPDLKSGGFGRAGSIPAPGTSISRQIPRLYLALSIQYLAPLGMTANALSLALRVPAPRINDIVRERRAITPDTALRLARYFDKTPEFWLNLQSTFDLKQAEQKIGQTIQREIQPMAVAA